ncbi:transmembrane 9 superfamily member 5-like [Corylus avellana]|uniref:transmembrane 9 superfamily member 5 n=1 Tax=Corylus avellana TaxID=13451 RepID=UPI00286A61EE|nr:transmembrane 9 superfamily member 5 [Corylus avellana]XP_059431309.1 transmembrane 9 superfamily member 5-like [Corylus avellana]
MSKPWQIVVLTVLFAALSFTDSSAAASPSEHRYNVGDRVPLFVNKVGPLNNPSETYYFYDLPFCRPDPVIWKKESFGEVLNGDRLTNALYELKFREEKSRETLCQKKLKVDEVSKFRTAVHDDFYFQMYYDDLPLWGFIGKLEESEIFGEKGPKYYLFKHVQFDVLYNGDRVVEIQAFSDPNHAVDITEDVEIDVTFTYSVIWNESSTKFENRMDKYTRASLVPIHRKIHWFSFINSIVIIVLLMGLLALLFMRRLKNDMKKCANGDEEEDKEVGWKYIHGDVFRCPPNLSFFCAVLGTGTQLLTQVFILFLLASFGALYPYNRGALLTSLVLIYSITSAVAGYTAASFHNQFAEAGWEWSVRLAGILYLGPLFVTVSFLNTVAISYGATAALPFGTIIVVLLVCSLVGIPLLALGGVIGYRFRSEFQAPCATKRYPREIPPLSWYRKTPCQMFVAGILSFSAIVLELHHLYASVWGYKIFTLPGILFITFVILIVLTSMMSVGLTYIQLSVEDYEWWWRSVLCGGSTAIFMFGYCIYFYARSNMNSFMQLSFFIGYNACMCYAFFLILGTISFCASLMFVRHIYHAVKSE